jgi:Uma2 family endonuclease
VKVGPDTYRESDVLYIPAEWADAAHEEYTERAALVIEVVSESNRDHDLETKRNEYADARIPEYWIVDPQESLVTVLKLKGDHYIVYGEHRPGERAVSSLVPAFSVSMDEILAT